MSEFQKGFDERRNMNGRPKRPEVEELRKALKYAQKQQKGVSFLSDYCVKAYTDSPRAIALLRKLVPDLTEADLTSAGLSVVDILALMRAKRGNNV